ncbi:MAG: putative saccharopine dehydrogenase/reductase, partial [Frankiales bacterium]|nr:putative saccharopine dehydrogenase/reductase [Frankiales bacterium]
MTDRTHDVVLYGATGFVGRLTAAYLARSAPDGARIALGGRSRARLEAVRATLPARAAEWPLVVADSTDAAAMDALAASTTAVATTVGPYAKFGMPLVQACARAGTHYADLTGEVLFVRDSIDVAHDDAVASGARVVHACGFDSIPSELGVLLAAEQAKADGEGELAETVLCLVSSRGGVSGGTLDSLRNQVDEVKADSAKRRTTLDPHSLSQDRAAEPDHGKESDFFLTRREPLLDGRWVAPFVMAPFNTRIVRRSNSLTGHGYGRSFRYSEVMGVGSSPAAPLLASAVALGAGGVAAGLAVPPTRWLLDRRCPGGAGTPAPPAARRCRG